jgi:hypothetical protein
LIPPDEHNGYGQRGEQAAVEHAACPHEREQLARLVPEVVEVDEDQHQLGADECRDDEVDPEVHHPGAVDPAPARPDDGQLQRHQVGGCQQDAVRVHGPITDLKQDGMHVG